MRTLLVTLVVFILGLSGCATGFDYRTLTEEQALSLARSDCEDAGVSPENVPACVANNMRDMAAEANARDEWEAAGAAILGGAVAAGNRMNEHYDEHYKHQDTLPSTRTTTTCRRQWDEVVCASK